MAKLKKVKETAVANLNSELPSELSVNTNLLSEIKESCRRQKLTIGTYVKVIKDCCEATKIVKIDNYGKTVEEPDHERRLKGALAGLELEGYIKSKEVINDNSKHSHVTYAWLTTTGNAITPVREI